MKTEINENQLRSDLELALDEADNTEYTLPDSVRSRFLWPFRDSTFGLGLLLLSISAGVFLLYDFFDSPKVSATNTILFMLHYSLALTISLVLYMNGFLKFREQHYPDGRSARWMGMLLWLISAYALNREIPVFQQSTEWLCWALVLVSAAMVLYTWKEELSVRMQQLLYAVLAFGWWLFAYMAIYVIPLYLISVPMLIGLGLSIHSFVPLLFAVVLGKRLWQDAKREEHVRLGVGIGLSVPLLILGFFLSGWIRDLNHMEETHMESTIRKTSDLPDWVLIAQRIQSDGVVSQWITNRLLLSNRVYDQGQFFNGRGWGLTGLTAFDDVRQHDPLVVIASQLFPTDVLSNDDQLALLKVLSSNRHGAEEKLWTGRHLTTQDIVSQVRIWPQFRVSYTEQTLRIRNQARNATEEALMTFHLPAGSVVSSMSLWVNGREEPARLTTVAKADSAYRTIVGVESRVVARDPSVVYWQEGNRVTVRVFPCRAGEDRRVKLGITSPLLLTGKQLIYQTPTIEGPDASSANELVHVEFASSPTDLKTPWFFDKLQGRILTHKGSYEPNWSLRFQTPALSSDAFLLNEKAYQVEPLKPASESFTPTDVYLDVNQSWTKNEFIAAFQAAKKQLHCRIWVFDDGLEQLTEGDLDAAFERHSQQAFSLFPIYRIANPESALLITKGTAMSPTLSDLRGSRFADNLGLLSKQQTPIRTFCFVSDDTKLVLSPYLKTLAELLVLNMATGNTDDLQKYSQTHQFPGRSDEPDRIALPEAGIVIRETPGQPTQASVAPDHIARLFTYNHLLYQIGRQYFVKNYQTEALIQEAQQAHIVSPLSSLVVLETEADYDRFGIRKDHSGLDNATLKQEGAVPEPHEWALLLMLAGLIGWGVWKKNYAIH
ncbi:XrtN system VIT domain-containing protein [Spirosoma sp. KCTC 42546]|uniref:XrtN system VIT domain-containing protein n=1 Tax=Spirosoma sp. KCTC 42546 TaxID=2520506 RepID=UPI001158EA0A|nr:XrtN system VIT domain-containing protein [Spirosoma sp. KCTC 42546]QDK78956.1 XrtN system VIT domain-containing protein [Spirosoma sp. KCTC 42546]